jgi:hypothetical protein
VAGQGIVVTGFTNPANNGFSIVETVESGPPPRIVVRPYEIDPATGNCGDQGGRDFPRPCQLLPDPGLVAEPGSGIQIRSSATYLTVELNPESFYTSVGDPRPKNDPDGEQLVGLPVDFVDGGTEPGDDSIQRTDPGSWIQDGYRVGLKFPVTGATDAGNNQTFTVTALTDSVLTVQEQVTARTADLVTAGGALTATGACLSLNAGAETNCCYSSGRRQVVFETRAPGVTVHAWADADRDFLVGPARVRPDPLLRRGAQGAGGQELSTGRWDTACGENCHSFAGNHRKDCIEDAGLTGECDLGGALGQDEHNNDAACTQCHAHADGFARGNPGANAPVLDANSCILD